MARASVFSHPFSFGALTSGSPHAGAVDWTVGARVVPHAPVVPVDGEWMAALLNEVPRTDGFHLLAPLLTVAPQG